MRTSAAGRDRALDLRGQIRDYTIAVAVGGTIFLGVVAATTLPGHSSPTASGLQQPAQAPGSSSGGSGLVTGGSSSLGTQGTAANGGAGLQQPAQLPSSGLGGGGLVTGGS